MMMTSGVAAGSGGTQQGPYLVAPSPIPLQSLERGVPGGVTSLSIDMPPPPEDKQPERAKWLCIDLSRWSPQLQFLFLSGGVFLFFILNSYAEEYLFKAIPSFHYGWYMTFFELCCFTLFAAVERTLQGQPVLHHTAPLKGHAQVAVAMTASRGLTNMSLSYLNYPTQVIFKSMKLITVMIGSIFMGKKFSGLEVLQALCFVARDRKSVV